MDIDKYDN